MDTDEDDKEDAKDYEKDMYDDPELISKIKIKLTAPWENPVIMGCYCYIFKIRTRFYMCYISMW